MTAYVVEVTQGGCNMNEITERTTARSAAIEWNNVVGLTSQHSNTSDPNVCPKISIAIMSC